MSSDIQSLFLSPFLKNSPKLQVLGDLDPISTSRVRASICDCFSSTGVQEAYFEVTGCNNHTFFFIFNLPSVTYCSPPMLYVSTAANENVKQYSSILNLIVSSLLFRLSLNEIIGHILRVRWLHEMLFRVTVSVYPKEN